MSVIKHYNLRIEESDFKELEELSNMEVSGSINTEIRKAVKEYIRSKKGKNKIKG